MTLTTRNRDDLFSVASVAVKSTTAVTMAKSSGREPSILPRASHVAYALEASNFDLPEWTTKTQRESFRNRLEGFAEPVPPYDADHDQHYVHNQVHIFVGGTQVPLSPNSPYFWLHHGMIDYVFEQWMSNHSNSTFRPTAKEANEKPLAHPGHNPEEYIVPFFPTVTHLDVFKPASEFGYEYESSSGSEPSESPPNPTTTPSTTTSSAKKQDTFLVLGASSSSSGYRCGENKRVKQSDSFIHAAKMRYLIACVCM